MSWDRIVAFTRRTTLVVAAASLCHATSAQNTPDPNKLLQDADRLAWVKNWTRAEPLYADAESFDLLGDAMDTFGGSIVNQALSSVSPFARQLFVEKEFLNDKLASALGNYRAPEARQLIRNTCEYLVRTKWGRA